MNGEDLKRWREERRLTQIKAAEKLGVSRAALQKWEARQDSEIPKWAALAISAVSRRLAPYDPKKHSS